MSGATDYAGLILFDEAEAYDVDSLNANSKEIDKRLGMVSEANATLNTANVNCTLSTFTRLRFGKESGIISAHVVILFDKVFNVPTNNASALALGTLVPVGYRPDYNIGLLPGVISGNAAGGMTQIAINTDGGLSIRSSAAAFTPVIGSQTELNISWRWDGKLV